MKQRPRTAATALTLPVTIPTILPVLRDEDEDAGAGAGSGVPVDVDEPENDKEDDGGDPGADVTILVNVDCEFPAFGVLVITTVTVAGAPWACVGVGVALFAAGVDTAA